MKICILAGGPVSCVPDLNDVGEDVLWVGVDRGVFELRKRGIHPSYAFGDFDSIPDVEKQALEAEPQVFMFPPEKDKTDLELAMDWAIQQQVKSVAVYGATGGRLDHELANIGLLDKGLQPKMEIKIIDRQNMIMMRSPGTYPISYDMKYPYVSFLPFGDRVDGLTLEGFKYPLTNVSVGSSSTLTVSNELIEKTGTYSFTDGILIVIRSRDESNDA